MGDLVDAIFGGGDDVNVPPPDPQIGAAALRNAELSKDWLNFAKETYADSSERQALTDSLNTKVINQQLATQDQANTWAQEDRARTLNTFQPVEDAFVKTYERVSVEKRAALIAAIYEDARARGQVSRDTVLRLIKLASNP